MGNYVPLTPFHGQFVPIELVRTIHDRERLQSGIVVGIEQRLLIASEGMMRVSIQKSASISERQFCTGVRPHVHIQIASN